MKQIEVTATIQNLPKVFDFLQNAFDGIDVTPQTKRQIKMCVEEIYTNIANYAYNPEVGPATVTFSVDDEIKPAKITITFSDSGKPYDPLKHEDPDLELSLEETPIGGLGIFLVKETMDKVEYKLKDGKNVLIMEKNLV